MDRSERCQTKPVKKILNLQLIDSDLTENTRKQPFGHIP